MKTEMMRVDVVDIQTGAVVRSYNPAGIKDPDPAKKARQLARRWADKADLQYGAIRYSVRPVYASES